jgi:YegS/Rv2252/BmrU family lipid kinase
MSGGGGAKLFLIVNLIAGHGRCKALFPKVRAELDRRGIAYELHYTNEPLEATDVAKWGIDAGFQRIVAMGGDGTINEVANGLLGRDAVLAVIPAGTGNDFVRMLGIPADPFDALDLLAGGVERTMDLGRVNEERCFVNGMGIGLDAQVARDVLQMSHLRGAAAYVTAAIKEIFRFDAFPVTIESAEWRMDLTCLSIGVSNGKFAGGGFKLAPEASVDDGMIDISVIEDYSIAERLVRLPQVRAGKHLGWRKVHYRQLPSATISSPKKLIAHMDGEPYRLPSDAFTVSILSNALRVIVPR